jgi:hypothetical protein
VSTRTYQAVQKILSGAYNLNGGKVDYDKIAEELGVKKNTLYVFNSRLNSIKIDKVDKKDNLSENLIG